MQFSEELRSWVNGVKCSSHGSCTSLLDMDCFIYIAALSLIGAKPNLYCKAIELVCGGSPKVCVLVERKALDIVKSEL